jgi:hypothetical protein
MEAKMTMAIIGLGLLGIFAIVTTVNNADWNGSAYTLTDRYEPATGFRILNDSTMNVDTPNFNGTYGFRVYQNRITEISKGGFENPDVVVTSDEKETRNSIPEVFWFLIGPSNRINVSIAMDDGTTAEYGATTSETVITDMNIGGYRDADYTVKTDEQTVIDIANTTKPSNTTELMYRQGRIKIEANGFIKSVQLFIANVVFSLFG